MAFMCLILRALQPLEGMDMAVQESYYERDAREPLAVLHDSGGSAIRSAVKRTGLRDAVSTAIEKQSAAATRKRATPEEKSIVDFWGKKREAGGAAYGTARAMGGGVARGVARAALEGASRLEILGEALSELRSAGAGGRIGIWMVGPHDGPEASHGESGPQGSQLAPDGEAGSRESVWRGVVWDGESPAAPREWEQLSAEAPIPQDVLLGVRAVAQEFEGDSNRILISILVGMRRVLWTPIAVRGCVLGVILCGTRERGEALPEAAASRLAAELALQLAWTEERTVARERYADLALARRLYAQLNAQGQTDAVLAGLADSMVTGSTSESGADGGLRAAFVSIGVLSETPTNTAAASAGLHAPKPAASSNPGVQPAANSSGNLAMKDVACDSGNGPGNGLANMPGAVSSDQPNVDAASHPLPATLNGAANSAPLAAPLAIEFRWKSGDPDWLRVAEGATLTDICQEALHTGRTAGMVPQFLWMHTPIARIVAVPIQVDGEVCGVLLAGLSRREASLAALERLEYRAMIAGLAIARQKRERTSLLAARRQRTQLSASRELLFVLDEAGRIVDLSSAVAELLRESGGSAVEAPPSAVASRSSDGQPEKTILAPRDARLLPSAPNQLIGKSITQLFRATARPAIDSWLRDDRLRHEAKTSADRWNTDLAELQVELATGVPMRLRRSLPTTAGHSVVALERLAAPPPAPEAMGLEQALQGVIEWLEEGVVLFDAKGRVRACNVRFAQFAGLAPGEPAVGITLDELIDRMTVQAADPTGFAERWRALAREGDGGVRDELRMTRPTPRILERASRPVLDAVGQKLGRVEIYRDLTAQRVFQSKLLQTEKLAALGQMITGVAHELSNPLTSILGYAQRLLLRDDVTAGSNEVRQIFQEAERAGGILRQLLFSAREAPPERRRVALNQVVMRSMDLQRFSMSAEKIRVELDLDPALPMIMGDAAQLQQVLMNLVGNARQAIQQHGHGGSIRVRTRQIAERRVQLNVEDDGPGVPQSILARIFDPFFTTKAAGVGTGLGLSIVLSIVREHGGRVNVLRGVEGGAIFSVELPVAEGLATTPAASPQTAAKTRASAYDGAYEPATANGPTAVPAVMTRNTLPVPMNSASPRPAASRGAQPKARVLVVEDEPTVARLIADVLQDEGFLVDVLLDGQEALERAAQECFDLVICDMKMPGLDGQHFYQRLAESGNPLRHSFLFVTGDVIAPTTQAFLERSGLPHLAKPFRVEELTARVHQVLDDTVRQTSANILSASSGPQRSVARK
jgi:signal transduction histidine kinase/CheY-like chemotaxis protein